MCKYKKQAYVVCKCAYHVGARGYLVNTVGLNEEMIKRYGKYQEGEERKEERDQSDFNQPNFFSPLGFTLMPPTLAVVIDLTQTAS
jgi:hypothetical protein